MSSSVTPFVSGIRKKTKSSEISANAAYSP